MTRPTGDVRAPSTGPTNRRAPTNFSTTPTTFPSTVNTGPAATATPANTPTNFFTSGDKPCQASNNRCTMSTIGINAGGNVDRNPSNMAGIDATRFSKICLMRGIIFPMATPTASANREVMPATSPSVLPSSVSQLAHAPFIDATEPSIVDDASNAVVPVTPISSCTA